MTEEIMNKAVVLLSGGIDSTTVLQIAIDERYRCHGITFRYGQKHIDEVACAKAIAARYKIPHTIVEVGLGTLGKSSLTTPDPIPTYGSGEEMEGIDSTYVPARNAVFLSLALAYAETRGCNHIFFGANKDDYDGYPDCRTPFFAAFEAMANVATAVSTWEEHVLLHTPLLEMTKAQIIKKGMELGVDYTETLSCYQPGYRGKPCGACGACVLRREAFAALEIGDPADAVWL